MGIHQITRMTAYIRYLQENTQELDLLFKELLIGVTNFFRDPAAWDQLRDAGHSGAAHEPVARPRAAGVGARLLHRGRGLFPGHRVQGGSPAGHAQGEFHLADLRHRPGSGRDRQSPPGPLSAQHRRRCVAGAADPVLCQRRPRLPGAQRDSRDGDLCPAESGHGSALYQAGHFVLPQPADLSGPRGAEETDSAVSLQPECRRHPVPRQRRNAWQRQRAVYPPRRQIAALPADGIRPAAGASRVSRLL